MNNVRDWEFLFPWFERLRSRLRPHFDPLHDRLSSHPVRVGLDVADWWIFVDLTDDDDGLDDYEATVQQIREALLLVGAFARINRVCCWQFLQNVALFDRAAWMDLDDPAFRLQFVIDVTKPRQNGHLVKKNALMTAIGGVLGSAHVNYSEDFVKDWARMLAMCNVMGLCLVPRLPVTLRVIVDLQGVAEDNCVEYCEKTMDGICRIQSDRKKSVGLCDAESLATAPCFQVAAMDLYIREIRWSANTIHAIQRLTDLDIPLHTVELPTFESSALRESTMDCRLAWRNLLCSLTGQLGKPTGLHPSRCVRRLVVPQEYAHEPLRSSLFSAMVESRGIRELEIKIDTQVHPLEEATEISFWTWVKSAVFREHPSWGALESLSISGVLMTTKFIKGLIRYQSVHSLVEAVTPGYIQGEAWTKRHERITITSGSELKIFEGGANPNTTRTECALSATVLFECSDRQELLLLVPGVGICSATKVSELAATQEEVPASEYKCGIRNLKLDLLRTRYREDYLVRMFVKAMGGEQLQGLHIGAELPESILIQILEMCTSLEFLGVAVCAFNVIRDAYERGMKIMSLHLLNLGIEYGIETLPEVNRLLIELKSSETAIAREMERLCLTMAGKKMPGGRTEPLTLPVRSRQHTENALHENKVLTHLWYLPGLPQRTGHANWTVERNHGKLLLEAAPRRMEAESVLAFLYVLQRKSQGGPPEKSFSAAVKSRILSFAAEPQRRSMLCEELICATPTDPQA